MMQGPASTAIAVRQVNGKIVYSTKKTVRLKDKYPILGVPIIRGVVSFIMSLYNGVKTLTDSAAMAGLEAEEPSKFEKKIAGWLHMKPDDVMMIAAVVIALVLSIGLFFAVPTAIEAFVKRFVTGKLLVNLIGGVVRITMFLLYVYLCSKLKEIRRVFMYHGAEHKSIFCFENGDELTVENARKYPRLHPRCGTSFLVIVMLISILMFVLMGNDSSNVFSRLASRLALLPLVAGVSYEILQALGRAKDNAVVRALKWPGLMVQKITTAEPDDEMLEVALVALKASLGYPKDEILPPEPEPEEVDEGTETPEQQAEEALIESELDQEPIDNDLT